MNTLKSWKLGGMIVTDEVYARLEWIERTTTDYLLRYVDGR
jgi:hypothetical protein